MANVRLQALWNVDFTQQEFAVLLRVLGGRATDSDEQAADELCDKLTQMRVDYTRNLLKQMDTLEDNLHSKIDARRHSVAD